MSDVPDEAELRNFAVRFAELAGRAHELLFAGDGGRILPGFEKD